MIKLAKTLEMPHAAVTQTFAFLGKRGGGKTYAATKLAEEMLTIGAQIIALDVVGNWYGLRIPKDKRNSPFDIHIFGGRNADIEINPKAGKIVAGIILQRNLSAVIDLSEWIHSEQVRFMYDFLVELFEYRKAHPAACHVFLEEAQEIVPENLPSMAGGENYAPRLLGIGNRMVKIGRNFGIGCSLISQRPQEVSKKILDMCEVVLAFQMTGLSPRDTVSRLTKDEDIDVDVRALLPKLEQGQAFVWSPSWLKIAGTYKIAEKLTADVSATPEVGAETVQTQKLEPRDVTELTESIRALTAEIEANTPAALKKRIAELERELSGTKKALTETNRANNETKPPITETIEIPVIPPKLQDELVAMIQWPLEHLQTHIEAETEKMMSEFSTLLKKYEASNDVKKHATPSHTLQNKPETASHLKNSSKTSSNLKEHGLSSLPEPGPKSYVNEHGVSKFTTFTPNKTQQRILDAVAWYESIGNPSPSLTQIGAVALIDPTGGHFSNTVGPLSSNGLVIREHSLIRLTPDGRFLARIDDSPKTLDGYHEVLRQRVLKMKSASRRTVDMLNVIIERNGNAISNAEIGQQVGIDHTGGHFSNTIGPLSTAGLIRRSGGMVEPTEVLFPEGLS